ncbi:FxsA family membrane protein [Streptomyces albipurpureus]|uniref:FxsA family protein n=1 Tax=Streptomyces albipurpureus TaxID=2897419 RepID=A0ABT0UY02_9ACTN|nr:FxsA family membrane protein [Streptomyces sp. CWNU-1]MCM2393454.1 FxsA family protein [Streptomyces sp. CWNU-1]
MTTGATPPTAPKRSRARSLVPLAIAAWLVLEVWLLILVADVAGGLTVFALLIGAGLLGGAVIKRAGRRAFRNLSETLQRQQSGLSEPQAGGGGKGDGNGFLMLGGLLIMLPGLLSDVLGLALLVPPVRSLLGRYAERSLERRMRAANPGSLQDAFQQARIHRPDGKVVPGEVIRQDAGRPEGERGSSGTGSTGPKPPLTP